LGQGQPEEAGFQTRPDDLLSVRDVAPAAATPWQPGSLDGLIPHSTTEANDLGIQPRGASGAPQSAAIAPGQGGGGSLGAAAVTGGGGGNIASGAASSASGDGSNSFFAGAGGTSGQGGQVQSLALNQASHTAMAPAASSSSTTATAPTTASQTSTPALVTASQPAPSVLDAPVGNSIQITCSDVDSLSGWTTHESGGSDPGRGTVVSTSGGLILTEGNSYNVGLDKTLTIPNNPSTLVFQYDDLSFDTTDSHSINDAFEVALVDDQGKPLVSTIGESRNAFLNVTEGLPAKLGAGTTESGTSVVTVTTDISGLKPQSTAHLVIRLINNDSDHNTTVRLTCPASSDQSPSVAVDLFNDTAPTGPGTDAYRTDRLTNDPTVTGTASDDVGIATLEARVDGGAYQNITSTLSNGTFKWTPTGLAAGSHHVDIRATDTSSHQTVAGTDFRLNASPVANAGTNQTISEGGDATYDARNSTDVEGPIFSYLWTFADGTTSSNITTTRHYAQDGSDTATLTVTDTAGSAVTTTVTTTINNLPPTIAPVSNVQTSVGATVPLVASFADPGVLDKHTAQIDWGDGNTQSATVTEGNGSGTVSLSHVYTSPGTRTGHVRVYDDHVPSGSSDVTFQVTVAPTPPTLILSGAPTTNEASTYTLNLSAQEPINHTLYQWSINWGDGSSAQTIYGNSTTSVTHVYTDGLNSYTITATGTDQDGTWNANSIPIVVNNVPPTLVISGAGVTDEGATYTLGLSSTDPGQDTISGWTIDWGDGSTSNVSGHPSSTTHVYATGPHDYVVKATATDEDGTWNANSIGVHVNHVAPTVSIQGNGTINEGSTYTLTLPTSGPSGSLISSWTIQWGDGSTSSITGRPSSTTHVYADGVVPAVTDAITATATTNTGSYPSNTVSVQVNNVAPKVVSLSDLTRTTTPEGSPLAQQVTATFTDPGVLDTHTATFYWGDGTSSVGIVSEANGSGSATANHVYADNGRYTVHVVVTDKDGASASLDTATTITNVAPTVTAGFSFVPGGANASTGAPAVVISGQFTDPGFTRASAGTVETFTTTIAWGDGTTSTVTPTLVQGSDGVLTVGTFSATHNYANPGVYQATVTVTDDDAGQGQVVLKFGMGCNSFDVMPAINSGAQGVYPLKVYSCGAFDVHDIIPQSLRFGPGGAPALLDQYQIVPAQGGRLDVKFDRVLSALRPTDTVAYLSGQLTDGTYFVDWAPLKNVHGGSAPTPTAPGQTKFYVADAGTSTGGDTVYRYLSGGGTSGTFAIDGSVPHPSGIAVDATGTYLWMVDASNQEVGVQKTDGTPLGSFRAFGLVNPQGITTNGTNLWILDAGTHQVLAYRGAASLRAGGVTPSSAFHLDPANDSPSDIVTRDGSTFWVTDDHAHAVFVYNATGHLLGHWSLDSADVSPSGITLNPTAGTDLWVVDRSTGRVYDYAGATAWTSGSHAATSSFALASADAHPEAIADPTPPVVTIDSPANNTSVTTGSGPVLVSGQVQTSTSGTPVVSVNGSPVDAVDAGNNFFSQVDVTSGPNALSYTATDASGQSGSSATLQLNGRNPSTGPIDFSLLTDVTQSFAVQYGRTSLDSSTSVLYADMSAQNVGTFAIDTPLLVGVRHISDPTVQVRDFDGVAPDGTYYYDYSKLVGSGTSRPGDTTGTGTLAFYDPQGKPFTYDLVFLGHENHAPAFTSVPIVEAPLGAVYKYASRAADPDPNDTLSYRLVAGPQGMSVDQKTGVVTWNIGSNTSTVGNHAVRLRVDDDKGASGFQDYVLTIVQGQANRPPQFDSTPVVDAYVGSSYLYPSHATDPDFDSLTYSLVSGPAGLAVTSDGKVLWSPTSDELGVQHVTIQVIDGHGGTDTQVYDVVVHSQPDNQPPVIVSTPQTRIEAPLADFTPGSDSHAVYTVPGERGKSTTITFEYTYSETAYNDEEGFYIVQDGQGRVGGILPGSAGYTQAVFSPGNYFVLFDQVDPIGSTKSFTLTAGTLISFYMIQHDTTANLIAKNPTDNINGNPIAFFSWPAANPDYANDPSFDHLKTPPPNPAPGSPDFPQFAWEDLPEYNMGPDWNDMEFRINLDVIPGAAPPLYVYPIAAVDPDGDPVTYHLVSTNAPGKVSVDPNTGMLIWEAQPGNYTFTVQADDDRGGQSLPQTWEVQVDNLATGQIYGNVYDDANNTGAHDQNENGLEGVTVFLDANNNGVLDSGEATTVTDSDGSYSFLGLDASASAPYIVRAIPPAGWASTQPGSNSYSLTFNGPQYLVGNDFGFHNPNTFVNHLPTFTTTPPNDPTILPDQPQATVVYKAHATDLDNDPLTFDLPVHPAGMVVDPDTGVVSWNPIASQAGSSTALVRVKDTHGGVAVQSFTVEVPRYDSPPIITSTPAGVPLVGKPYVYQVRAQDAENDTLVYTLAGATIPSGMSLNQTTGLLTWTPANTTPPNVTIVVDDQHGGLALQLFNLTAVASATDHAPSITSNPRTTVRAGQTYVYPIQGYDPDGDPLAYHLTAVSPTTLPAGLTFDSATGRIQWPTTVSQEGSYSFSVTVDDGRGLTSPAQAFTVVVSAAAKNSPPSITTNPETVAVLGNLYAYDLAATDPDHDPLLWSLDTAPPGLSIDPVRGTVRWNPTDDQVGSFPVTVRVNDPYGGSATQSYTINVRGVDTPPQILSAPQQNGAAGQPYTYAVRAEDADGDPIQYQIVGSHPTGLDFSSPSSNLLKWANPVAGSYPLTIEVSDGLGGTDTQSFTLVVAAAAPNHPPVLNWIPKQTTRASQLFTDTVVATDPDGDSLQYQLLGFNYWLSIGASTGVLSGTPSAGTYTITVQVTDGHGGVAEETYALVVKADAAPTFDPVTVPTATAGVPYEFDVHAKDADGDPLTYSLTVSGLPTGETPPAIDSLGRITWQPGPSDVGVPLTLHVTVTDTSGVATTHDYSLTAVADLPAPKVSLQVSSATAPLGGAVTVVVQATDNIGVASRTLTYAGKSYPLDAHGAATITLNSLGTATFTATATDAAGNTSTPATATVNVFNPNVTTAPKVSFTAQSSTVAATNGTNSTTHLPTFTNVNVASGQSVSSKITLNDTATIADLAVAFSIDDVNDADLSATLTGPNGMSPITLFNGVGVGGHNFTNTVLDDTATVALASGTAPYTGRFKPQNPLSPFTNRVASGTYTLTITNHSTTNTATFKGWSLSYRKSLDALVTAPIDVLGTVQDANLQSYTLSVAPVGSTHFTQIASGGTTQISDGKLGTFDPTTLPNGAYVLELKATNTGNLTTTVDQVVNVGGNLKLGNLHLSFSDLTIPVAGIPITITRTYDTLNANTDGDFGYGWTLDEGDFQLQVSQPDGTLAPLGVLTPFEYGTRIVITRPGQDPEGFTFEPQPVVTGYFGFQDYVTPRFVPDLGVTDRLTVPATELITNGDGTYSGEDADLTAYNPADSLFGSSYMLTTHNGTAYTFDASTGQLSTASDRNGNTLTYTDGGIFSSSGVGVSFTRDYAGRITTITDPRGDSIVYDYDVDGNLISVTDRNGNATQFVYAPSPPHTLDHVIDATGRTVAQVTYTGGRVTGLSDASGNTSSLTYDLNSLTEQVTPPGGGAPSTVTLDALGNATGTTDALGHSSAGIYDGTNLTSQTQTVGGQTLTTSYSYTPNGEVVTATDAAGHVTRFTYDSFGLPMTETDALGNTTTFSYDANGNLISTRSPGGVTMSSTYTSTGQLATTTTPNGTMSYTYYGTGEAGGNPGNLASVTDPRGITTFLTYDPNNNPTGTITIAVSSPYNPVSSPPPSASLFSPGDKLTQTTNANGLVTDTIKDAQNRVVWTDTPHVLGQPASSGTRTTYSGNGISSSTTLYGVTITSTSSVYNGNDQLVQSIDPTGTTSETVYDADGRAVWSTDAHLPGKSADGIHTIYDADGRIIRTEQYHNVVITVTVPASGAPTSAIASHDTNPYLLSSTVYDAQGRVTWADDAHLYGQAADGTHIVYDANGNTIANQRYSNVQIAISTLSNGSQASSLSGTPTELSTTETFYDEAGRAVWTDDVHAPGATGVAGTHTSYNADGTVASTERHTNVVLTLQTTGGTSTVVLTSPGTLYSSTSSTYDAAGRFATSTDARGYTTSYLYDGDSHLINTVFADGTSSSTKYDASGRKTSATDPDGNTTTYKYNSSGDLSEVDLPAVTNPTNTSGPLVQPVYHYAYDTFGNLIAETDPNNHTTKYVYDAFGEKISETLPQLPDFTTPTATWSYDALGQLASTTDFDGHVITYAYDAEGRVTETEEYANQTNATTGPSAAAEKVTYTYDSLDGTGRRYDTVTITSSENPSANGTTTTYYDVHGNLVEIDSPQGNITYTYDLATGQKTSVSTSKTHITYAYDHEGRLATVTTATLEGTTLTTPLVTTYHYDLDNNLVETDQANGTVETRTYDTLDRLTSVVTKLGTTTLVGYTYVLDNAGLIHSVTEANGRTDTYTYDADGRLTQEAITSDPSGPNRTFTYVYDLAGNRYSMSDTGDGSGATNLTYYYDAADRLTQISGSKPNSGYYYESYTYDHAGNTLTHTVTNYNYVMGSSTTTTVTTYGWDVEGRLISAVTTVNGSTTQTVSDAYDDAGNRVSETVNGTTTTYLNDLNQAYDEVLEEYAPGGVLLATYVRGLDLLFQDRTTAGGGTGKSFYAVDGLGSTRALTNTSGTVTDTYTFDAYGNLIKQTSTATPATPNEFLYAGYQFDAAIGQDYLRARYYDQATGRFNSRDSMEGSEINPITFNMFAYAGGNPVSNTDPSGHDFSLSASLAGSTIAANLTAIEGGVFGYVESLARQDIQSFQDFALANVTLALQEFFPGIVSALQSLYEFGGVAAQALAYFNLVGFDVYSYDSGSTGSGSSTPPGTVALAAASLPGVAPLGGKSNRAAALSSALPPAAAQLNFAAMKASKVLAALYEALLAYDIVTKTGQIIPTGGWGHNPNANGSDIVSVDTNGDVYLWDAKARNYSLQNSPSKTFSVDKRNATALTEAERIIRGAKNLDQTVINKAVGNIRAGRVNYRTAYAKVGTPGWRVIKGR